jgi:hypothetical protein
MGNFSSPLRTPAFRHSTFDTPIKQARVEPAFFLQPRFPWGPIFSRRTP